MNRYDARAGIRAIDDEFRSAISRRSYRTPLGEAIVYACKEGLEQMAGICRLLDPGRDSEWYASKSVAFEQITIASAITMATFRALVIAE